MKTSELGNERVVEPAVIVSPQTWRREMTTPYVVWLCTVWGRCGW